MKNFRAIGSIDIDGCGASADYDIVMEWDGYEKDTPDEMDVLRYMLDQGIIQIMSESIEEYDGDDDEGY